MGTSFVYYGARLHAHPGFALQVGTLLTLHLDPEVAHRSPPWLEVSTATEPGMSPQSGCRSLRGRSSQTSRICVWYVSMYLIDVNIADTERMLGNFQAL
jgi:hypothetical protein